MPVYSRKKIYKGRGLKVKDLRDLLETSYLKIEETPANINDYILMRRTSTNEVKVFVNHIQKQFVIVIRGTDKTSLRDLYTDARLAFGNTRTDRFTSAKKILDNILKLIMENPASSDYKIDVIGHSLGGAVAYEISRKNPDNPDDTSLIDRINNVITVNSAGKLDDKTRRNPHNRYDIRSEKDFLAKWGYIPPQGSVDERTGESRTYILNPTEEDRVRREKEKDDKLAEDFKKLNVMGVLGETFGSVAGEMAENPEELAYEHKIRTVLDRFKDDDRFIGTGLKQRKKKPNKWVAHAKAYAKKYKVPYYIALKEAKKTYNSINP